MAPPLIEDGMRGQSDEVVLLLALFSYVGFVFLKSAPTPYIVVVEVAVCWHAFLAGMDLSIVSDWDWKRCLKESAIAFMFLIVLLLTIFRGTTKCNKIVQVGGLINLGMIPLLAFRDKDIVAGLALTLLTPFVPAMYVDQDYALQVDESAGIIVWPWRSSPLSQRWFWRLYYVIFLVYYMFGHYWLIYDSYIWLSVTCLVPLIGMEVSNHRFGSDAQWFLFRLLVLVNGNLVGIVHKDYNTLQSTYFFGETRGGNWFSALAPITDRVFNEPEWVSALDATPPPAEPVTAIVFRNLGQAISIGVLVALFVIKDCYWTTAKTATPSEETREANEVTIESEVSVCASV